MAAAPNRELVVFALSLLGGESKRIHTEDIAIKCYELFPQSFSWAKYPQFPDKDIVRVALTDARKNNHGALVEGRTGAKTGLATKTQRDPATDGWRLTTEGIKWLEANRSRLEQLVGEGAVKEHRQLLLKQLRKTRDHKLFQRFSRRPEEFKPSIGELADLLKCRVDAPEATWQKRFEQLEGRAHAAGQEDLLKFLDMCKLSYSEHKNLRGD